MRTSSRGRCARLAAVAVAPFFFVALLAVQHQQLSEELGPAARRPQSKTAVGSRPPRLQPQSSHTRTLLRNGPALSAVDVVFFSEAYTGEQAQEFFGDVSRIIEVHFKRCVPALPT